MKRCFLLLIYSINLLTKSNKPIGSQLTPSLASIMQWSVSIVVNITDAHPCFIPKISYQVSIVIYCGLVHKSNPILVSNVNIGSQLLIDVEEYLVLLDLGGQMQTCPAVVLQGELIDPHSDFFQ